MMIIITGGKVGRKRYGTEGKSGKGMGRKRDGNLERREMYGNYKREGNGIVMARGKKVM